MLLYSHPGHQRRSGVVLLVVLVAIVLLTLAAYKYNDWMVAEFRASDSSIKAGQARAFASSGVHYAAALVAGNIDDTLGGNPWDNAGIFSGIAVPSSNANALPGRFSIVSRRLPDEPGLGGQPFRYGLTDEAAKINLNALLLLDRGKGEAGKKILLALPNMTEDIANAILDWLDPDSTPRTNGAENETYSTMSPPYRCKNGPFDSIEELLLVRGVTPELLFGNDYNRNGSLDSDEPAGAGGIDLGWSAYLTVYSREVNVDSTNLPRLNINDSDVVALKDKLVQALGDEDLAVFIIGVRLFGTNSGKSKGGNKGGSKGGKGPSKFKGRGGRGGSSGSSTPQVDPAAAKAHILDELAKTNSGGSGNGSGTGSGATGGNSSGGNSGGSGGRRGSSIRSLWDLIDTQVSVSIPNGRSSRTVLFPSPLKEVNRRRELLPKLLDKLTTNTTMDLTPKINVNTAPQIVLMGLKEAVGLSDADLQNISNSRPQPSNVSAPDPIYKTLAWLSTEVNLPVATLKKLDPYITARSQVYRMQVVGYFDRPGPTARVEAVIDANQGRPRIVYWRDLSELGKGFDLASSPN